MSLHHRRWRLGAAVTALAGLLVPLGAQAQTNDRWLTIALPAEPPDLEGCQSARQQQGRVLKQNLVETLVERDAKDFSMKPRLATSWERTDDRTWRFHLRQGVTFHDGTPFNAAAAKKSFDRTLSKAILCSDRSKGFTSLLATGGPVEVTAVDDYTLQIRTPVPDPILPTRVSSTAIVGTNTPPDKLVPSGQGPIGTGPYRFDSWQAGQQILLKRNDTYWGKPPAAEGVRYIWRNESSVRAAMVKIGEADIALAIAQQDATDPELDFSALNSETLSLRLDTSLPPLNDKRVRLAMNYALDRVSPVGTILPKTTEQATQVVMPAIPGHNHELDKKIIPYDPAKARQLLAQAKADGVPVDTEILMVSYPAGLANAAELMEAFYAMFKAVGLNIKLITVEPNQYLSWNQKPFPDPRPPFMLQTSHDNLMGDPVFSVTTKYGCDGGSSGYCDPAFDKEVQRVSTLAGAERIAGWQEVFRTLYEDIVPDITMYHLVGFTRVGKRIRYIPDVSTGNEVRVEDVRFR
jgi:peptide/nickel transport system substrate-binding protein